MLIMRMVHFILLHTHNEHNNFDDENTIILCVELTDGLLLSHGTRYEF